MKEEKRFIKRDIIITLLTRHNKYFAILLLLKIVHAFMDNSEASATAYICLNIFIIYSKQSVGYREKQ